MSWSVLILALPQTTWIVDQANGPGTHFADVPPAVAAAAHGDTILVRPSMPWRQYTGFQVSGKALTLRGASATRTRLTGVTVGSIPSGSLFVFEGLFVAGVVATNSDVVLTHCLTPWLHAQGGRLHVVRSHVFGGSCTPACPPGIELVNNATLVAVDSTIVGFDAAPSYCPQGMLGGVGIQATDSRVFLHACSVAGGTSATRDFNCQLSTTAMDGIQLHRSTARVSGGPGDVIETGQSNALGFGLAINALTPSVATVHGNVTLVLRWPAPPGTPPVNSRVALGAPQLPRLSVSGTTAANGEIFAGQPITLTLDGGLANAPAVLGYSQLPLSPIDFAPFSLGEVMLPLPSFAFPAVLDGAGQLQIVFAASVAPALLGIPVFGQAAVLDGAANTYRMSNVDLRLYTN